MKLQFVLPFTRQSENDDSHPVLRRADQMVVAVMLLLALVAMAGYWFIHGGHRGELIEIDRAEPLSPKFLVDINEAEWPELLQLPEVGEVLAKRIVVSRKTHGLYQGHSDLMRVDGIGPKILHQIKPYLLPMPDGENIAVEPTDSGGAE